MCDYMRGEGQGRYTDLGERYFHEFNTLFWKRPGNK